MSMHIVAKFISAVCLALELGLPRMLQQWMRAPWWERTPHSCWHSPYRAGSCSHIFGSPSGAGSHQQPGGPKSFSKGLGLLGRMGAHTRSGEPWKWTRGAKGDEREDGFLASTKSGWRNPLTCWFGEKGLRSEGYFVWVYVMFELSPTLICDLYFTVVFYCCLWHLKKR